MTRFPTKKTLYSLLFLNFVRLFCSVFIAAIHYMKQIDFIYRVCIQPFADLRVHYYDGAFKSIAENLFWTKNFFVQRTPTKISGTVFFEQVNIWFIHLETFVGFLTDDIRTCSQTNAHCLFLLDFLQPFQLLRKNKWIRD